MNDYIPILRQLFESAEREIDEFADRKYSSLGKLVLTRIVKPYCDKRNLRYHSNSLGFAFIDVKRPFVRRRRSRQAGPA